MSDKDVKIGDIFVTELADRNLVESIVKNKPDKKNVQESIMAEEKKDIDNLSFEQAIKMLGSIVSKIESGDTPLQSSLDEYERGMNLIKHCRAILQAAEKKIEIITQEQNSKSTQ